MILFGDDTATPTLRSTLLAITRATREIDGYVRRWSGPEPVEVRRVERLHGYPHRVGDAGDLLTERLLLRQPRPDDLAAILSIHQHPSAIAHNPSDALAGRGEAQLLLRRWLDRWRRDGFGYWTIRWRERPPVLGFCGLKSMQLQCRPVLNLFYRLDPDAWGLGIATEAAFAVVDWAKINRSSLPVIARIGPENLASARVAAKVGLHRAEHLDEHGADGLDLIYRSAWPSAVPSQLAVR